MAAQPGYRPYEPLLVLKAWADSIWTVDGPEVGYGFMGLSIPCPTRMTVIRLGNGDLWVHSPVEWSPDLGDELTELGPVRHLIAPNMHHYVHLKDWANRYPDAAVYALPQLAGKIGLGDWQNVLGGDTAPWGEEIEQVFLDLGDFREVVFFHRASRTLIVTDLMMNFEASRIANPIVRFILSTGGATGPKGQPSIDMRMAIGRHGQHLKAGLEAIIAIAPEAIILAHGVCFETGAVGEIRRAFPKFT